jgi:hypothetical protein
MGVRLDALPDYLTQWKVPFALYPGYRERSRSSGDFAELMAVGVHHTASSTTPERDLGWMYLNSPDRPIGNGLLDRTGKFTLGAVRATNTQGKGGPYLTSRGVIPLNAGNSRMFSIEAANNGTGEPWPAAQMDTYVKLCACLVECISETTPGRALQVGDIVAHFEWAPGRKFDPAGNSPYAAGAALWDMDKFRRDVYVALNPPTTPTTPITGDDDVTVCVNRDGEYHLTDWVCRSPIVYPGNDLALVAHMWELEDMGVRFASPKGTPGQKDRPIPVPFPIKPASAATFDKLPTG